MLTFGPHSSGSLREGEGSRSSLGWARYWAGTVREGRGEREGEAGRCR